MKNLSKILILFILLFSNNINSQCNPISIPMISAINDGGSFCLEGSGIFDTNPTRYYQTICLNNELDKFSITRKANIDNGFSRNLELFKNNLTLIPPNNIHFFDLDFSFIASAAAKTTIRSKRALPLGRGTELQFLTHSNLPDSDWQSVQMTINSEGRIGIGTTTPNYILDVFGDAKFTNENSTYGKLVIKGANQTNTNSITPTSKRDLSFEFVGASSSKIRAFRGETMDTYLQFMTSPFGAVDNPIVRMQINENGNVGIGTTAIPKAKLEVIGKTIIGNIPADKMPIGYNLYVETGILAEKVKVAVLTNAQWSDFVFEPSYKLKPLFEVEKYIIENRHLPNIPSADELVKDGLDLGKMQAKQMEKIEELTLYLIEIKKEVENLKKENIELKKKITHLKN